MHFPKSSSVPAKSSTISWITSTLYSQTATVFTIRSTFLPKPFRRFTIRGTLFGVIERFSHPQRAFLTKTRLFQPRAPLFSPPSFKARSTSP
jgi:hypothetical protein